MKRWWVLILGTAGCFDPFSNGKPPEFDVNCESCRTDGQSCEISYNCPVDSVCNLEKIEDDYDPSQPANICIKVYCAGDADCAGGTFCQPDRRCSSVCQRDADCVAGACFDGACTRESTPRTIARCVLLSRDDALITGAEKLLVAAALDEFGTTLSHAGFRFTSSEPEVAAISGDELVGGALEGRAVITAATESGISCEGSIQIYNFLPVAANISRVVVLDELGRPLPGASVILDDGARENIGLTGARGAILFSSTTTIAQLTISAPGHDFLTVIAPGGRDLIFELPRSTENIEKTGFGGAVKLAPQPRRDVAMGLVSAPLANNPFGFDLTAQLCDTVRTPVNIPELGFPNTEVDLLSAQLFRFGKRTVTDDSALTGGGDRCRGRTPTSEELGCYLAASAPGPTLSWAFAGQIRFSSVSSVLGQVLAPTCESSSVEALALAENRVIAPLAHGVGVAQGSAPYSRAALNITAPKAIYSAVKLPDLPDREPEGLNAVIAVAAVDVPDQGLIPIGTASGFDRAIDDPRDGRIDPVEAPFGRHTRPLPAGQIPLSMSPPHGVLSERPLSLILLAFSQETELAEASRGVSAIVRSVPRVEVDTEITETFLAPQRGQYNISRRSIPLSSTAVNSAWMLRVESAGKIWRIYSPGGQSELMLPRVSSTAELLDAPAIDVRLGEYETIVPYADHFRLGSRSRPKNAFSVVSRFAIADVSAH